MERMIDDFLDGRRRDGLFRELTEISLSANGMIETGGIKYINFSSNDYLALASHPRLADAAKKAMGASFGTSSSRLMAGSTRLHARLEEQVAAFKGKPAALVFNSGYQANVGIISALCGRDTCVFSDRLNHASILDGVRLSGAELYRFRHNDIAHLEELLKKNRNKHRNSMIITETVFSMDGDISPLAEMTRLKKEHDSLFMVDEAHATGIFGRTGSGLAEETATSADIDIIMGTFSKALGAFGAYAAFSEKMRDYLVNTCRSFIYSTALPPAVIAADIEALALIKDEPWRREKLISNTAAFREKLSGAGIETKGTTQIIPIMSGENEKTVRLSELLKKKGYWVTPIRPPTVPEGESRVRISISYDHSRETLDKFVKDLTQCMGT